jgi:RHS repeat-associated protein
VPTRPWIVIAMRALEPFPTRRRATGRVRRDTRNARLAAFRKRRYKYDRQGNIPRIGRRHAEGRLVGTSQFREPSFGIPTGDSLPLRSQSLFDGPHEVVERFFHQTWDSADPDEFGPTVEETWRYYHGLALDAVTGASRYQPGHGNPTEYLFIRDHLGSIVLVLQADVYTASSGHGTFTGATLTPAEAITYTPYGVPTIHSRGTSGEAILRVHNESISHSQADGGTYITDSIREGEAYGNWVWAAESPRGATDQDGRVAKSAAQSSIGLKYLYASRPWSPVAEAYHNRARWYSPEAGRFLTRDPIGYLGGVNQYMYANGNPVGFRDPWGLRASPEGGVYSWTAAGWAAYLKDLGVGEFHPLRFTTYTGELALLGFLESGQAAAYLIEGYDTEGQLTGWGYAGYGVQTAFDAAAAFGAVKAAQGAARGAQGAVSGLWARIRGAGAATNITPSGASSANAAAALNSKLSALQGAQANAARVRNLPDGRIRYYGPETPARTPGPTRGAAEVTEWNQNSQSVRMWRESYDHSGNVNRVHPQMINGQQVNSPHYPPTGRELGL